MATRSVEGEWNAGFENKLKKQMEIFGSLLLPTSLSTLAIREVMQPACDADGNW